MKNKIKNLQTVLATYTVPGWTLERWGGTRDGGYVVFPEAIAESDVLYSYGVGHSTTFEVEYCTKTGNLAYAFDHTVKRLPNLHEGITWVREGVAGEQKRRLNTYANHYSAYGGNSPLLKIDIDGWEYETIKAIPQDLLEKSPALLLEVHTIGARFDDFILLMEKLNKTFALVHIHPNNWGRVIDIEGYPCPDVIELSFVNKKVATSLDKVALELPLKGVDRKSHSRRPDIFINYLYENDF